jgi:hypothetical protein
MARTLGGFAVGDEVTFGRGQGQQTKGTVVRLGRTKLKVRQDEARGVKRDYPVGSVWTVPPSLCTKLGEGGAVPATPTLSLSVGQTVEFQGYSWDARCVTAVKGVVTKASRGSYEVYGEGRFSNQAPADVKAIAKRDDATLVRECSSVYGGLSPENLTCDGELSRTQVRARAARLKRALKALFKEAGREITESETWRAYESQRKTG